MNTTNNRIKFTDDELECLQQAAQILKNVVQCSHSQQSSRLSDDRDSYSFTDISNTAYIINKLSDDNDWHA